MRPRLGSTKQVRKLRVLHLGNPTGLYGAERWILALIRYLPESVESIVGVIEDRQEAAPAELLTRSAALGFETQTFAGRGRLSVAAIKKLRSYLVSRGINILHTHGYKTDIVGLLAARGTECRVVSTPHGWTVGADLKLRAYECLDRIAFVFMDAVVPLSLGLHDGLARWLGWRRNLLLIRNGVDIGEIEAAKPRPRTDSAGDESFLVGYIGRLVPGKGIPDLIKAFAAANIPKKQLWIIGSGPQDHELQALCEELSISKRVNLLGYREDRLEYLKVFDLFVLPSYSEGIPRCLLEAMAADIPVVATDIAGCRAVIEDQVTGYLYPPGDVKALASILLTLCQDRGKGRLVRENAKAFVLATYSAQRMAEEYAQLYSGLANGTWPAGSGAEQVDSMADD